MKCYNPDCEKPVDFELFDSFFCSPECKEKYNRTRPQKGKNRPKRSIPEIQEKLKQWGRERANRGRLPY